MADWKIAKRQAVCAPCQHTFEDGEAHFSALFVREGRLEREDRCTNCFETVQAVDLCWWKTVHHEGKRRGLRLDFEAMEALFVSLEGREEPRLAELRYLLCLLLMRKKRLKIVRIRRSSDGEAMILRRPRREEELSVTVFELTAERAEELRADLVALFDGMDPDALGEPPEPTAEPEAAPDGELDPADDPNVDGNAGEAAPGAAEVTTVAPGPEDTDAPAS